MRTGRTRLLMLDLRRSWVRLVGAGLGVALAAAVLTFLLGLGFGIESAVIGELTPADRIEVAKKMTHIDLGPLRMGLGSDVLDSDDLKRLEAIDGVASVWPKVGLGVPAVASGGVGILGQSMVTELAVEGIAPDLIEGELGRDSAFRARSQPGSDAVECHSDRDCSEGEFCLDVPERMGICRAPVPVVVSEKLIDLYNGSLRRAYGLPRLNPEAAIGLGADIRFGASSFSSGGGRGVLRDRMTLVGFSERAMPLGVTMPLEEVRRLNAYFGDGGRHGGFDSVVLGLVSGRNLGAVSAEVKRLGYRVLEEDVERMATAVSVAIGVLALVGLAVLLVAGLGVVHTFALLVEGRRREIAILRAVGATATEVSFLFLSEAGIVGVGGGVIGSLIGVFLAGLADRVFLAALPRLPLIPETLFVFRWDLLLGVVCVCVFAAVGGAVVPVWRALRTPSVEML